MLAILGADVQGRWHLGALPRAGLGEVRVASRTATHAAMLAARPGGTGVGWFEEAVVGADVVCCCTDARQPVIRAAWLASRHPPQLGELGARARPRGGARRPVFVQWRGAVLDRPPAGAYELQRPVRLLGGWRPDQSPGWHWSGWVTYRIGWRWQLVSDPVNGAWAATARSTQPS